MITFHNCVTEALAWAKTESLSGRRVSVFLKRDGVVQTCSENTIRPYRSTRVAVLQDGAVITMPRLRAGSLIHCGTARLKVVKRRRGDITLDRLTFPFGSIVESHKNLERLWEIGLADIT